MKSNPKGKINKSLPPLTVPPTGEPHLQGHAALTSTPLSTSSTSPLPGIKPHTTSQGSPRSGVKRPALSPAMQQGDHSGPSDTSAAALADKKRNKLGYHRSSVACAHCRRRKIRCLVATEDPQGRCQNCIRLKKECNFFPVDQQPPNERQRRPPARGLSQTSSSPAPPHASAPEQAGQYPPPPMPLNYSSATGSVHGGTMPMVPIETGAYNTPLRSATWDPSYMESPMSAGGHTSEVGTPGYWKSPVTGEYPSYGSQPDSARSAYFTGNYSSTRHDSWGQGMPPSQASTAMHPLTSSQSPMQQRSMSLQQQDGTAGIYGSSAQISESPYYDTRGPPSLYASTGSPATSVSLSDGTSAPGQTQLAAMNYGAPGHNWDPSKGGMEFGAPGGWYPDPNSMSHPLESSQGWSHNTGPYKQD